MANGIIVIDKPQDWTSMDVCAKLRGVFHEKRVGHGGTLDPMATGVLPVFVGRATRAAEFVAQGDKEYIARLRLGVTTDTQDVTGNVVATSAVPGEAEEKLRLLLPRFTGDIFQIPPMYSAIKRQGKKLYELARKGVEVERPPRPVTIFSLDILGKVEEATFEIKVVCSKGTYIRTLCHDLGQALGCGGTMAALRRTRVGAFSLENSVTLEELMNDSSPERFLRPVETCFDYPQVKISGLALKRARNGNIFPLAKPAGMYRVFDENGDFLLVGQCDGQQCRIVKSFYEVDEG